MFTTHFPQSVKRERLENADNLLVENMEFKSCVIKSNFLRVDIYKKKNNEKNYLVKTFQNLNQIVSNDVEAFLHNLLDFIVMNSPSFLCKIYNFNAEGHPGRLSIIMKYHPIYSEINYDSSHFRCDDSPKSPSLKSEKSNDRLISFIQRKKSSEKPKIDKALISLFKALLKLAWMLEKHYCITQMQVPWSDIYIKKNFEVYFDLFNERFFRTLQIDRKIATNPTRAEKEKKANAYNLAFYYLRFLQHANLLEPVKNLKDSIHPSRKTNIPTTIQKYLALMLEDDERLRPELSDLIEMMNEEEEMFNEDMKEIKEKFVAVRGKLPKRLFYLLVWIAQRVEEDKKNDFFEYTYSWLFKDGKQPLYSEKVEELYDDNEKMAEQLEILKRIYLEARKYGQELKDENSRLLTSLEFAKNANKDRKLLSPLTSDETKELNDRNNSTETILPHKQKNSLFKKTVVSSFSELRDFYPEEIEKIQELVMVSGDKFMEVLREDDKMQFFLMKQLAILRISLSKNTKFTDHTLRYLSLAINAVNSLLVLSLKFWSNERFTDLSFLDLARTVSNSTELVSLKLDFYSNENITDESFIELCRGIFNLHKLEHLVLKFASNENLTDFSYSELAIALGRLKRMKRLKLNFGANENSLEISLRSIVKSIIHMPELKRLTLVFQNLLTATDKFFSELSFSLIMVSNISHLDLDFSNCFAFFESAIVKFTKAISTFVNLVLLSLQFNNWKILTDKAMKSLAMSVESKKRLRHLKLCLDGSTLLTDDSVVDLLGALKFKPELTSLHLSFKNNNNFTDLFLNELCSIIADKAELVKLNIELSSAKFFSEIMFHHLAGTIHRIPKLKHLELDFERSVLNDADPFYKSVSNMTTLKDWVIKFDVKLISGQN